jgi:hypothetical protein
LPKASARSRTGAAQCGSSSIARSRRSTASLDSPWRISSSAARYAASAEGSKRDAVGADAAANDGVTTSAAATSSAAARSRGPEERRIPALQDMPVMIADL